MREAFTRSGQNPHYDGRFTEDPVLLSRSEWILSARGAPAAVCALLPVHALERQVAAWTVPRDSFRRHVVFRNHQSGNSYDGACTAGILLVDDLFFRYATQVKLHLVTLGSIFSRLDQSPFFFLPLSWLAHRERRNRSWMYGRTFHHAPEGRCLSRWHSVYPPAPVSSIISPSLFCFGFLGRA